MNASLLLTLTILAVLLTACQNRSTSDEARSKTDEPVPETSATASSEKRCYAYTSAADTIRLALERTGDAVTGDLTYRLKEKDRNTGTVSGQMHGDTLFAEYTFRSEGLESVREVAFLVKDERAVEGYGTLVSRNGKEIFAKRRDLNFMSSMVLNQTDCPR
jgi:ABC-type Fe3+-hydroxamate transport system substrate-binding protein